MAGGVSKGRRLKAVIPGGSSAKVLTADEAMKVSLRKAVREALRHNTIAASTATTIPELLAAQTGLVTRDNTGSPDASSTLRANAASSRATAA